MGSFVSPSSPSPPPAVVAPPAPAASTAASAAAERRRPSGLGTVATSFRGLLDETAAPFRRKSLLGE